MKQTTITIPAVPLDHGKIKSERERLGLSQQELADRAGTTQPHIADLENGKRKRPSLDLVASVADALGMTVDRLLIRKRKSK